MELGRATIEDIQTLLEIEETASGSRVYSRWCDKKEMKERLDTEVVYLIKDDGAVTGSISYEIKNDEHADISALVVKPEFQRRGLARKAMELIMEELKSFQKITLEVHPDNHSVKLYESFGFAVESRQENYYDGEPRLIMVKKI